MRIDRETRQELNINAFEGEDPDLSLVQRAQSGDRSAFDTLAVQHRDRIFHVILRIVESQEDAEDQLQETYLQAYRSLRLF